MTGLDKINLTELALPDVLQIMVTGSGQTWEDVATTCGWSPANVNRIRDPRQNYWPTLPKISLFCVACTSTLLLDWLYAQVEIGAVDLDLAAMDCTALLASMGELFSEMGDVAKAGNSALHPESEGGCSITNTEARKIIRELIDVINKSNEAISRLRPLAGVPGDRI
ncbi:hypothetical protein GO013_16330 [Pseudodesulfovibrio sp. JC047]|uniref:phage regulatory CII family protein n=1 Tax=Pseudodesulfovibrio sp. JC047 TaxID=2683199 RepID=UPI0013D16FF3|nr:phage regulatory CII family protein [Pseudodesulfovibrio sp. JC047]NDV20980.1 hypothetical protein [Pseudodesulfovibrio sp. JC047]